VFYALVLLSLKGESSTFGILQILFCIQFLFKTKGT